MKARLKELETELSKKRAKCMELEDTISKQKYKISQKALSDSKFNVGDKVEYIRTNKVKVLVGFNSNDVGVIMGINAIHPTFLTINKIKKNGEPSLQSIGWYVRVEEMEELLIKVEV